MEKHPRAIGAHASQYGDHIGALGDIGLHAAPDADATDEQRTQPDDHQEAHEQIVVADHRPKPIPGGAYRPAGVVQGCLNLRLGLFCIARAKQNLVAEPAAQARQRRGSV
jgi:hypothetical protein